MEVNPGWLNRIQQIFPKQDHRYLLTSFLLQLSLGAAFGHVYDMRIFMATGYLVATGQNPYISQNLSTVFNNPAFQGMTSIGYPPPWPLLLGFLYLVSYALLPNLILYGLAIKLPIIAANLCLAYLVRYILQECGAAPSTSRRAWIFLLFNPFLLYFTTAWGQFDSVVALFTLLSLLLLHRQKLAAASILLSLAISLKPISTPLVLVAVVYLWGAPWHRLARFLVTLSMSFFVFCIAPFIVFNWDASPIQQGWNAQFSVSGGMSLTTLYELWKNTYLLPENWWLLGFVWIPAVLLGIFMLKRGQMGFVPLLKNSLLMILIFFLTRTWLSEPNITLILPMLLILTSLEELPRVTLSAAWILPLIFTVFNSSPPQLLFPLQPELMARLLQWMDGYRSWRLIARSMVVIPWQIVGWWLVARGLRNPNRSSV